MNSPMIKPLIATTLVSVLSVVSAPANSHTIEQPHVYSTYQFPQTKATDVRHTIRLHVHENSERLIRLSIAIPKGLTVKNNISIEDKDGRLLPTASEVKNGVVTIDFATPLVGIDNININLNQVNLWGLNRNYQLTATYQGQISSQQAAMQNIYVDSRTNTYSRNLGAAEFRRF